MAAPENLASTYNQCHGKALDQRICKPHPATYCLWEASEVLQASTCATVKGGMVTIRGQR